MKLYFEKNVQTYIDMVEPLLLKKEACNNLMLGILNRATEGKSDNKDVQLGYVENNGEVIFAFMQMQTPPNNWIFPDLESVPNEVPKEVATFLSEQKMEVPGIIGSELFVKPFINEWEKINDVTSNIHMKQLVYQLDVVNDVPRVEGELMEAESSHHELITNWLIRFGKEANVETTREGAENLVSQFIKNRSVYLWQVNGSPVSMVNRSRSTKNGATVNAVFTPDAYKRKGYATSSVAALTTKLLEDGAKFCSLYTDANYPTSNRIYKKIGYYEVGTSVVYEFIKK